MGWSGGTEIMRVLVENIRDLPDDRKTRIYSAVAGQLRMQDWDVEEECEGLDPVLDEVLGFESSSQPQPPQQDYVWR